MRSIRTSCIGRDEGSNGVVHKNEIGGESQRQASQLLEGFKKHGGGEATYLGRVQAKGGGFPVCLYL